MVNDIVIDQVLGRLENGQREFLDDDDALYELKLAGVIDCKVAWNNNGDMEITLVTAFNPPPSRHFLQPYRALRDLQKKLETMRAFHGTNYRDNLLNAARMLSKRLLEMETSA